VPYDEDGLICVTWGMVLRMTWSFWGAYMAPAAAGGEAYAVLSNDFIAQASGLSPEDQTFATLTSEIQALRMAA
jgi:hypothetical protein